jgi:hypothetical protein
LQTLMQPPESRGPYHRMPLVVSCT